MIEVVDCKKCGNKYNGSVYSECPYCKNSSDQKSSRGEKKKSSGWGPLHWGKKAEAAKASVEAPREEAALEEHAPSIPQKESAIPVREPIKPTVSYYDSAVDAAKDEAELPKEAYSWQENAGMLAGEETLRQPPAFQAPASQAPTFQAPAFQAPASQATVSKVPASHTTTPQPSLSTQIQKVGKTTARYMNTYDGEVSFPAVGWLLAVKGVYYGKSFQLKSGVTRIGRNSDWEIALLNDTSVSREFKLKITYNPKNKKFTALADDEAMCYVNGELLDSTSKVELQGFEEIVIGEAEENMFLFIPLCGERFDWSMYSNEK